MRNFLFITMLLLMSCAQHSNDATKKDHEEQNEELLKSEDFAQEGEYIKEHYDSGMIKHEGHLINGKRNGLWKAYYENGVLWSESVYKNNFLNGPTRVYYSSGVMRYQGRFKNGKRVGKWTQYEEDGKVKHVDDYPI